MSKENNNNSRTANSIRNLITGFGGQLLSTILRFVTRTVFISVLGKEYLGINGLFSDILTMLSLTELGLDVAINYRLYKPLATKDDKRVRILVKFYKQAYRIIGAAIFILGLCMLPVLPWLIKDYDTLAALGINAVLIFLLYLLQSVSSYLFFAYRSAVLKANQKKYILDTAGFFIAVLSNVAQIISLRLSKNFIVYTLVLITFVILQNLINAVLAEKYYPQFFIKEPDHLSRVEIKEMLKDCGALFVYKANTVVIKATDNLVLSRMIGLAVVGLYSNYLLFYTTLKSLLHQVYNAILASTGNLFATEDIEKTYKFFQAVNFLTVFLYGTAGVGIAVCGDELIRVWISESYVIPQPLAILVGVEILLAGLQSNLGQIRNVSGAFRQLWYRPILGIIINIAVSIVLAHVCGIYGVIIGTIVAETSTIILIDPRIIHKHSFKNYRPVSEYYKKNLLYFLILAAVCTADMWICSHFFIGLGWFSLIIHVLLTGLSVPLVLLALFWKTDECKYLAGIIKRVWKKVYRRLSKQ